MASGSVRDGVRLCSWFLCAEGWCQTLFLVLTCCLRNQKTRSETTHPPVRSLPIRLFVSGSSQQGRICARPEPAGTAAWSVGQVNSGQVDIGGQPRFSGAKKWVTHSALSDHLWAGWGQNAPKRGRKGVEKAVFQSLPRGSYRRNSCISIHLSLQSRSTTAKEEIDVNSKH